MWDLGFIGEADNIHQDRTVSQVMAEVSVSCDITAG